MEKEEIVKEINKIINSVSRNAESAIDEQFRSELDKVLDKLASTIEITSKIVNGSPQPEDKDYDLGTLLWQGANTFLAAIQLVRQGYFIEPNVLCRHAIEDLCLALEVFRYPEKYQEFVAGNISGEKCIGSGKFFIPVIGKMYGQLSEMSHPNGKVIGTHFVLDEDKNFMAIGGHYVKSTAHRTALNLGIIGFMLQAYHGGVQLIFHKKADLTLWERKNNALSWNPSSEELAYAETMKKLISSSLEAIKKLSQEK